MAITDAQLERLPFVYVRGGRNAIPDFMTKVRHNINQVPRLVMLPYMVEMEYYTKGLFSGKGGKINRHFKGDMMNAVVAKSSDKGMRGKLYIENNLINGSPDTTNDVAQMLELGIEKHNVYLNRNSKAKEWAEKKSPLAVKRGYIVVGGDNSSVKLGSSSKAYSNNVWIRANKAVSNYVAEAVKQALDSSANLEFI